MKRGIKILILCCLLSVPITSKAVHVIFRMDDPTVIADSITMRVLRLFNEKQCPLTVAMIPCDSAEQPYRVTDSLYVKYLQASNVEIALHGLNHKNIHQLGEFGGIDSIETNRRINRGKTILESQIGKEIVTFIPPFNIINLYVPQVMLNNGLYILSSNMHYYSYDKRIQYLPETLDISISNKGFILAAIDAIKGATKDDICVLMFHDYDLKDESVWQNMSNLIDSCMTNPDIELHTFQSLYKHGIRSNCFRYCANQLQSGLQKYALHKGVLHNTWLCWLVHILNAILYAMIPLVLLIGWCRKRKLNYLLSALFGSVTFATLALLQILGPIKLLVLDFVFLMIIIACNKF